MKPQLDRIEERLDKIDTTLVKNTISLEEHIRRTNLIEEELKPIKSHVSFVNALTKIIAGALSLLLAMKQLGIF